MLHFLEERQDFKPRSSFRSKPEIAFGISPDNPIPFRNQYAMLSPTSRPQIDHLRPTPSNPDVLSASNWAPKTDINQIEVQLEL